MWGIYISQAFLIAFNIWMARYHSRLLKKDKKIKHGWWGLSYVVLSCSITYFLGDLWLLLACFLLRKFLFDISLNLFRGLGIFYVSPELTTYEGLRDAIRKGKVIDWVHYKLFGVNSEIYQTMYFMGWIILNIKFAV